MSRSCPRRPQVIDLLLEPDPPADLLEHVASCADCGQDWDELRVLPRLLTGRALPDPDEVHAQTAGNLIRAIGRGRRRRQVTAGAAVLGLMAAAGAAGAVVSGTRAPPGRPAPLGGSAFPAGAEQVRAVGLNGVRLTADLQPRAWGTALRIQASGLPPRVRCELIADGPGQAPQSAGWWWSGQGSVASVVVATSWHLGQLTKVELVADGRVLASAPIPAGGH
jgi:hypothetical protein